MSKPTNLQKPAIPSRDPSIETKSHRYDYGMLDDFFENEDPLDVAGLILEINTSLFEAIALLHNNNIKFKVSSVTIRGFRVIGELAAYIDSLGMISVDMIPQEGGQS